MLTNSPVTIFHKTLDKNKKMEVWQRFNYENAWFFGGKGAGINKGYKDANDVDVRLPYDENILDESNFSIGDIIVKGTINTDINTQQDLKQYAVYNITSINNNTFGNNPHIHLGGR